MLEWREGKKNGHGEYTYPDGGKYIGQWKDNKFWCQGTLTHENGNVYSGEWENDEPVQDTFTRNGRPWHGSVKDVKNGR